MGDESRIKREERKEKGRRQFEVLTDRRGVDNPGKEKRFQVIYNRRRRGGRGIRRQELRSFHGWQQCGEDQGVWKSLGEKVRVG